VEPTTGARFCREWPYLHAEMFQLFVHPFAQAFPDRRNLLLLANRGPPLFPAPPSRTTSVCSSDPRMAPS
jgi:hypothetical protein